MRDDRPTTRTETAAPSGLAARARERLGLTRAEAVRDDYCHCCGYQFSPGDRVLRDDGERSYCGVFCAASEARHAEVEEAWEAAHADD